MKKTVVGAVIALLAVGLSASLVVVNRLNGRIAKLESARGAVQVQEAAAEAVETAERPSPDAARPAAEPVAKKPSSPKTDSSSRWSEPKISPIVPKPAAEPAQEKSASVASEGNYIKHVVEEGEDIVSLAIVYAVPPKVIRELNSFSDDHQPRPGDVVLLPKEGEDVGAAPQGGTAAKPVAAKKPSTPKTDYHEMKVLNFSYDGSRLITLRLSEAPDLSVVRQYISVRPLKEGTLTFSASKGWDGNLRKMMPVLQISGEFAYRTNVTLRIRKGFPIAKLRSSGNLVAEPLAEEYVHVFERENVRPMVSFADAGRYLPPMGGGRISLASINVDNIKVSVAPIPPENVVYGLALEEDAYSRIGSSCWYSDGEGPAFAKDLAGMLVDKTIKMKNPLNEREEVKFAIPSAVPGATNGIYLVRLEGDPEGGREVRKAHRVVCMTDLGLSVRSFSKDKNDSQYLVWVTSLTRGTPVGGVKIAMYSTANILVANGVTDTNGLFRCTLPENAQNPFAIVASTADGSDRSFMALRSSMQMDESYAADEWNYLGKKDVEAFVTTDRGIYRHDEKILCHVLVRNGDFAAPAKMPIQVDLVKPSGNLYRQLTLVTDEFGALCTEELTVPADQPSGEWMLRVCLPAGSVIGVREFKVEEFVPPQIRIKAVAEKGVKPSAFTFSVSAEHLFGGPAKALMCEGAVVFDDAPFCPKQWKGWSFGDTTRGLKPNFTSLDRSVLDDKGVHVFQAPLLDETGLPVTAVRATVQGTVFEDGGRPATARDSVVLHRYPYYIGVKLGQWVRIPVAGRLEVPVACVDPSGARHGEKRSFTAKLIRRDRVNVYRMNPSRGCAMWDVDIVDTVVADKIAVEVAPGADATLGLPIADCGEYFLAIEDQDSDTAFGRSFHVTRDSELSDSQDRGLSRPTAISIAPDKPFYRPGETPVLRVRSPFAGKALLTVMRDDLVYVEPREIVAGASEIRLRPVEPGWAPDVGVSIIAIQGVEAGSRGLAARAHGEAVVSVRRPENEVAVSVAAVCTNREVTVSLSAPGADRAVVTLVDEGINILTSEPTPDPVGFFFRSRRQFGSVYDLYERLLPVYADVMLKASGVKTGGGMDAELLDRISPVPTKRFKPLAMWQREVAVRDGKARLSFTLPEFAGEVRVTAVAYSAKATGAASVQCKATPRLVAQPDAPRFVAPGDELEVTLPLTNRAGRDGEVSYEVSVAGAGKPLGSGGVRLAKDDSTVLRFTAKAPAAPGEMKLLYKASGFGEEHSFEIDVPVRPAAAWRETSGVHVLKPGKSFSIPAGPQGAITRSRHSVTNTPVAELKNALEWLADYPYGCLEQTSSRIFPLITAGGILNSLGSVAAQNRAEYVAAGVRRVESMIRQSGFVMWPDCSYEPWDVEVSLYAAHFLTEAGRAGVKLNEDGEKVTRRLLTRWAMSPTNSISAYACHTLALAGKPPRDRMFRLYDDRASLDLLSRARLARAFALIGDRERADQLLAGANSPASVKEASFALLALLAVDPDEPTIPVLFKYLLTKRDNALFSWGTTSDNAHALMALGEYWRHHPVKPGKCDVKEVDGNLVNVGEGDAFVTWKRLDLPVAGDMADEAKGLSVRREFFTADGKRYDLSKARRGDLVVVRIAIASKDDRDISDLVVEDLFSGAMEPVGSTLDASMYPWVAAAEKDMPDWVMRHDARDDRMLVFSKKFHARKGREVYFHYPLRVVSAGSFALPQVAVEAMYNPGLRARSGAGRVVVGD